MDFLPVPHQVTPEHLATLSTPEVIAIRIELHEQNELHHSSIYEAQKRFSETNLTENPEREIALDVLSAAHQALNVHIRNTLVVDETLRNSKGWNRLKELMKTALRGSVDCPYYNDHDRRDIYGQIMTAELHPSKRMRLLGLLYPRQDLENGNYDDC